MGKSENTNNKATMHKKQRRIFVSLLALLACASLLFCGYTFAKYIFGWETHDHGIKASEFIFSLNLLNNAELSRTFNLYGTQTQSVTFSVDNFYDALNINKSNITYSISASATNDYTPILDTMETSNNGNFVLTGDSQDSHEFTLEMPTGYTNETVVTVEAVSSSPYIKTLTLEFHLHTDSLRNEYRIVDGVNSYSAELIIMVCEDTDVTIQWDPTELEIDCTSSLIMQNGTVPAGVEVGMLTLSRSLHAGESVSIAFFKRNIATNHSTNGNILFGSSGESIYVTAA